MLYRFLYSKIGRYFMQVIMGVVLCLAMFGEYWLLSYLYPVEILVINELIVGIAVFLCMLLMTFTLVYFMPRIYVMLIPVKPAVILGAICLSAYMAYTLLFPHWMGAVLPAFESNGIFQTACIVALVALVVIAVLVYGAYYAIIRKASKEITRSSNS